MKDRSTFGVILVTAMVAGALVLGSCTPSSPATTDTLTTTTKPTGSLKIALDFHTGGFFATAGKFFNTGNTFQALSAPVFDSLVEPTTDGQLRPGIAERWEISPDGKTQTFYIRRGVKFHNGDDLTGADVKFTITEGMLHPENTGGEALYWRGQVAGVSLKDDYTVVLSMKQPQFELLPGMENFMGTAAVLPKKYIEEKGWDYFTRNPIGSGPWRVVSFQPNTRFEFEAVENHWRAQPKFKNVTLLSVKEEATKIAMLKTGELDIAPVTADSAAGLKTAGLRVVPHYGASQAFSYLLYDLDNPDKYAFGDVRVRKAMSLAVDRKELADKLYGGYAQPTFLFFAPRTAFFFDPNTMKPDPYDPEGTKRLLAEAGYANGFSTTAWDLGGGGAISTLNQAVVGYWRRFGINAEIVAMDRSLWPSRVGKPEAWNKIFTYSSGGGIYHFERVATTCHSTRSSQKNLRIPKLDELIDKVPMTPDGPEKKRIAQEAVMLCKNDSSTLTYLDIDDLIVVGPNVGQFTPTKGMHGLGWDLETIGHTK